jgi:hypothetical protein
MHNDSLETLLLRHYGRNASAPAGLEQQLVASVRRQEAEQRWQQSVTTRIRERRISRRNVVRLVALTSAGAGLLSVGLESLRSVEAALVGQRQDAVQVP